MRDDSVPSSGHRDVRIEVRDVHKTAYFGTFISHLTKDRPFVDILHRRLSKIGLEPFYCTILPGVDWREYITEVTLGYPLKYAVVVIRDPASFFQSKICVEEVINLGENGSKPFLLPVFLCSAEDIKAEKRKLQGRPLEAANVILKVQGISVKTCGDNHDVLITQVVTRLLAKEGRGCFNVEYIDGETVRLDGWVPSGERLTCLVKYKQACLGPYIETFLAVNGFFRKSWSTRASIDFPKLCFCLVRKLHAAAALTYDLCGYTINIEMDYCFSWPKGYSFTRQRPCLTMALCFGLLLFVGGIALLAAGSSARTAGACIVVASVLVMLSPALIISPMRLDMKRIAVKAVPKGSNKVLGSASMDTDFQDICISCVNFKGDKASDESPEWFNQWPGGVIHNATNL